MTDFVDENEIGENRVGEGKLPAVSETPGTFEKENRKVTEPSVLGFAIIPEALALGLEVKEISDFTLVTTGELKDKIKSFSSDTKGVICLYYQISTLEAFFKAHVRLAVSEEDRDEHLFSVNELNEISELSKISFASKSIFVVTSEKRISSKVLSAWNSCLKASQKQKVVVSIGVSEVGKSEKSKNDGIASDINDLIKVIEEKSEKRVESCGYTLKPMSKRN